jgi:hypothetical protein
MGKNRGVGLYTAAIAITLLTALAVFHVDSAKGHSGGGGGGVNLSSSEPFIIVVEPGFPIHLQDPQCVIDRFFGTILRPDELANIMRQNWIEAFINKGPTEDERYHRHDLIERQLGYEEGQWDAAMGIAIVDLNYYSWQAVDFSMDWGTGIAQDVTRVPYNEVYDWTKHGTAVVMVGVAAATDMDAQGEYTEQAVDEVLEAAVDVAVGDALDNIKTLECHAPETLAELTATGVKGIKSMLDRAAERSDGRPSLGWAPTYAR